MVNIETAKGLILFYMNTFGFKGWASFWDTIYLAPGYENNKGLIAHEAKHLEQIERDGKVIFSVKYIYWLVRYGYYNNPYEVEARQAQTLANR